MKKEEFLEFGQRAAVPGFEFECLYGDLIDPAWKLQYRLSLGDGRYNYLCVSAEQRDGRSLVHTRGFRDHGFCHQYRLRWEEPVYPIPISDRWVEMTRAILMEQKEYVYAPVFEEEAYWYITSRLKNAEDFLGLHREFLRCQVRASKPWRSGHRMGPTVGEYVDDEVVRKIAGRRGLMKEFLEQINSVKRVIFAAQELSK